MATAQTAFDKAERVCTLFLGRVLGMKIGDADNSELTRDDYIDPDLCNKACFSMSGGPEQMQNYGVRAPGSAWYAYGYLLAQYETRADAIVALGLIQNRFPARRSDGTSGPGLEPNVRNFEMMEHPEIISQIVYDNDSKVTARVFALRARFRVVYDNTQDGTE